MIHRNKYCSKVGKNVDIKDHKDSLTQTGVVGCEHFDIALAECRKDQKGDATTPCEPFIKTYNKKCAELYLS